MSASEFVSFTGCGLILPVAPVLLALDLEGRGLRLWIEGAALCIGPPERLTELDRHNIRKWKRHLMVVVEYANLADRPVG